MTEQETTKSDVTEKELQDNKAVEQAYQAEMQSEIPDLWDRIEAALPEKDSSAQVTEQTEKAEAAEEVKTKKVIPLKTIRIIALIAACLCVTLMLPTLLSIGGHRAESAMPAELDESSYEESADMAAEAEMTESAPADEMTEAASESDAAENTGTATERNDFGSDALYTENVRVEVIECDTERGSDDDGYMTYTVMILEDASDMYELASTQDVCVDETVAKGIKAGDKLTVTLVNPDPLSSAEPRICMLLHNH